MLISSIILFRMLIKLTIYNPRFSSWVIDLDIIPKFAIIQTKIASNCWSSKMFCTFNTKIKLTIKRNTHTIKRNTHAELNNYLFTQFLLHKNTKINAINNLILLYCNLIYSFTIKIKWIYIVFMRNTYRNS